MISRNINREKNNLVWFKSGGKTIIKPSQNITINSLELNDDYTIEVDRVKFEKINESTYYLPRRVIIKYNSNKDFTITMGEFEDTLLAGENKISYSLQDGDDFTSIVLTPIDTGTVIENLNIYIEELSNKIEMDNYKDKQSGIANSLTQKLSTFKKELWYAYSYGLPLFEKYKTKVAIDSFVGQTITSQEGVRGVLEFESKVEKGNYTCNVKIDSIYGDIELSI